MHVRKQIRDAVGTVLTGGTTWDRVFNTRVAPARDVTPYLMVFIDTEAISGSTIHTTAVQERTMGLNVIGRSRIVEGEALEDALDAMAAEIETTLTNSALRTELSNNQVWLTLQSTSSDLQVEDENDREYAQVSLEYEIRLFTDEYLPETIV